MIHDLERHAGTDHEISEWDRNELVRATTLSGRTEEAIAMAQRLLDVRPHTCDLITR